MKKPNDTLTQLQTLLPDGQWQGILSTLAITGLVDGLQLQQATSLNRNSLHHILEKMEQAADSHPLFHLQTGKIQRVNLQGRAPKVYQLASGGADLLRLLGYEHAHPSQLNTALARAHALTVLDIHLAAGNAGLVVQTEKNLYAKDQVFIRPDCLVTLADGSRAIFECEQTARPDYLPRMSESLHNKLAFIKAGGQTSALIRVLFNLRPGSELEQTMNRWQGLTHLLGKENGGSLPFTLLGMSIVDFLHNPDWSPAPDTTRWRDLTQPLPEAEPEQVEQSVPELPPFSSKENAILLQAMLQWLKANNQTHHHPSKFPEPAFFDVMEIIYLASHHPEAPAMQRAAFPNESIYLLGQYLASNLKLRDALDQSILRGGSGMLWNATTILHRMQTVVDAFLEYHSFRSDGALRAIPVTVDWNELRPKSFAVQVAIDTADILPEAENKSTKQRIESAENALAWVLRGLFVHAARVGLRTPRFW